MLLVDDLAAGGTKNLRHTPRGFDTNSEMFLMIHLYQIAQLTTNGHYIFKQLSESVAQIMSQIMFLKTP